MVKVQPLFWQKILVQIFGIFSPKIRRVSYQKRHFWLTKKIFPKKLWDEYHFVYIQVNRAPGAINKSFVWQRSEIPILCRKFAPNTKIFLLNYYLDVMDIARKLFDNQLLVYVNTDKEATWLKDFV